MAAAGEMARMNASLQDLYRWKESTEDNLDMFFLIIMGIIIFLMQAGFAFLEAGAVRSKNTVNILIKNGMDSFFGGVSYWLIGYSLAFGEGNSFIGYSWFAHAGLPSTKYAHWFFQFVFAATAATIVSGSVAERCDFAAYMIYSTLITGIIYPVVTHWAWSEQGWLAVGGKYMIDGESVTVNYVDFAGSGVLHTLGGITAFVAALALGPRIGRFDKETGKPQDIKGHSVPLAALGGFILILGFFAFNGSSHGSISGDGDGIAVATAVKNTVLAASGGAFTTLLLNRTKYWGDKKWSFLITLNGSLTGMQVSALFMMTISGYFDTCCTAQAICAGCNQFYTYISFIIGILGGVTYMIFTWLVTRLRVDDPLDATAVHFGGGIVGVLSVPIFSGDYGILFHWDRRSALYLGWSLAGLTAIIVWSVVLSAAMFYTLKAFHVLRVPFEYEVKGLDIPKHGEPAYPAEAYGHGWGETGDSVTELGIMSIATATMIATKRAHQIERKSPSTPEIANKFKNHGFVPHLERKSPSTPELSAKFRNDGVLNSAYTHPERETSQL